MAVEADYLIGRSAGVSYEAFAADETLRRAFVRSLELSARRPKKVPDDFRAMHPSVEWRAMAGMRDRLIHDYFGVDLELVWDVVQTASRRSGSRFPALSRRDARTRCPFFALCVQQRAAKGGKRRHNAKA